MSSISEAYKILRTGNEVENVEFTSFGEFKLSQVSNASIHFINCIFHEGAVFCNDGAINAGLVFVNCEFKNQLEIKALQHIGEIEISGCKFEKSVQVRSSQVRSFDVLNSEFKRLTFFSCEIGFVYFKNSFIKGLLDLFKLTTDLLEISNSIETRSIKELRINCPNLNEFRCESVGKIEQIQLKQFNFAEINSILGQVLLETGDFKTLKFGVPDERERENSRMESFSAVNLQQSGNIKFENIFLNKLYLLEVDASEAIYSFFNVVIVDTIIDSCVFSKFYCNQLFFVENPSIVKSDVTQFVTNNLSWGKDKRNILAGHSGFDRIPPLYRFRKKEFKRKELDYDKNDIVDLRDLKDTYRQLKKASLANGNLIDALKFRTNEMQAYWREIRLIGGVNLGDTILIFLNRWTSNFGQSWILPIVWLFTFHLILFSFLMSFFWFNSFSFDFEFGQFWVLLNPVHKTPDYINTGTGLFTEFVMRILSAYFIYHFVKATRKFGRL